MEVFLLGFLPENLEVCGAEKSAALGLREDIGADTADLTSDGCQVPSGWGAEGWTRFSGEL